jgi:hypothetical protein
MGWKILPGSWAPEDRGGKVRVERRVRATTAQVPQGGRMEMRMESSVVNGTRLYRVSNDEGSASLMSLEAPQVHLPGREDSPPAEAVPRRSIGEGPRESSETESRPTSTHR